LPDDTVCKWQSMDLNLCILAQHMGPQPPFFPAVRSPIWGSLHTAAGPLNPKLQGRGCGLSHGQSQGRARPMGEGRLGPVRGRAGRTLDGAGKASLPAWAPLCLGETTEATRGSWVPSLPGTVLSHHICHACGWGLRVRAGGLSLGVACCFTVACRGGRAEQQAPVSVLYLWQQKAEGKWISWGHWRGPLSLTSSSHSFWTPRLLPTSPSIPSSPCLSIPSCGMGAPTLTPGGVLRRVGSHLTLTPAWITRLG
jgi:hypothetical protein